MQLVLDVAKGLGDLRAVVTLHVNHTRHGRSRSMLQTCFRDGHLGDFDTHVWNVRKPPQLVERECRNPVAVVMT